MKRTYCSEETIRSGLKDVWNAYMTEGAIFSANDIPLCPTTALTIPENIITWEKAKSEYKKYLSKFGSTFHIRSFVCFYIDDYKFDGAKGIWNNPKHLLKIMRHYDGVITPDFSTYQDFPAPIKIFAVYRMRLIGYWLGAQGIAVINNVRWGTPETYKYCFDGIEHNSMIAIGTVGGNPKKICDRIRFEEGFYEMVRTLEPKVIIVYGSSKYECFKNLENFGIQVVTFPGETALAFSRRDSRE